MVKPILAVTLLITLSGAPIAANSQASQPLFAQDDGIWVLFYDVSSRRFHAAAGA